MKLYFRKIYPSAGGYTVYYEYEGEWVTRQINVFPQIVLRLQPPESSDLPLSYEDEAPGTAINAAEFISLWERYQSQPHSTKRADSPLLKPPYFFGGNA